MNLDLYHDPEYEKGIYAVPNEIREGISLLKSSVELGMSVLTKINYHNVVEKRNLPQPSKILDIIEDDTLFLMLYTQIYYRRIHTSSINPTLEQRTKSYENYQAFFDHILQVKESLEIELPTQWIWEFMDEFVNQFVSFAAYRTNLQNRTRTERKMFKKFPNLWDPLYVMKILYSLIDNTIILLKNTNVVSILFFRKIGFFAIYCLVRIQTLFGDYHEAIKLLDKRKFFPSLIHKVIFSSVTDCQFSVAYHSSFSYIMMQRYVDAINILANTLKLFEVRNRILKSSCYRNSTIINQTRKMIYLLCMSLALRHKVCTISFFKLKNSFLNKMFKANSCKDKLEKLENELNQGKNSSYFKYCFQKASPDFVLPYYPSFDDEPQDYIAEAKDYQMNIFLNEVKHHAFISTMKREMNLSITKKVNKTTLFKFMINLIMNHRDNHHLQSLFQNQQRKSILNKGIQNLMRLKNKTTHLIRERDAELSSLDGRFETVSGVDFYLCHDDENTLFFMNCGYLPFR